MTRRRLLIVAGGARSTASTRHRLWNYRALLEADGVQVDWIEYGGGREASVLRAMSRRLAFLKDLVAAPSGQDTVLVQKILPPAFMFRKWKRAGSRIVYDFDDALYARSVMGEPEGRWLRRKERFDAALRCADAVVAGSPPLADYAATVASRVEVVYPSLERSRFTMSGRPAGRGDAMVVGWVGNDQSQVYLKGLEPVLLAAFDRHPHTRLTVCSSVPPKLDPRLMVRMDFVPWSEAGELEATRTFDVAISPLADEPWSRARGGRVSVLLSMASGVPVVASPGGGVEELVADAGGVTFADDPAAWGRALDRLLDDPDHRASEGAKARAVIDARIWADVLYPRVRDILFGA